MSEKPFPFSAEQFLDVLAEAVTLIGEVAGRLPRNFKAGSPRARLYQAARVVMRDVRPDGLSELEDRSGEVLEAGAYPASPPLTHEAALARRTTAEAALLEFELAEKRKEAGLDSPSTVVERLSVHADAGAKTIEIRGAWDQAAPVRLILDVSRASWLAEQLLWAKRTIDEGRG